MKILKNILLILFIFTNISLASNFEFDIVGSFGFSLDFSDTDGYYLPYSSLNGKREDLGYTANVLLSIGRNDKILNETLTSISSMFETGYNFYSRTRNADILNENYNNSYAYNSIILGALFKLNFYNTISLCIVAGIFVPISSKSIKPEEALGKYGDITEFNHDKIAFMYKLPFMPYIKLNVEKYFYFSEKWAFKIGANLLYNFGMEFDMDKLKSDTTTYGYNKYKFSSLSFEVFFGFGRPK